MKFLSSIRHKSSNLFSKRFFQFTAVISIILVALTALLPIWQLMPEIREKVAIPLHYNIHFGVDLFGAWWRIFTIPIIGFVIFAVNHIAAIIMIEKEKVLSYIFASISLISQILLFVGMVFVVLLNLTYG